jgi:hypothetical protein
MSGSSVPNRAASSKPLCQIQRLLSLLHAKHDLRVTVDRSKRPHRRRGPRYHAKIYAVDTSTAMWLQPIRLWLLCTRQTYMAEGTAADTAVNAHSLPTQGQQAELQRHSLHKASSAHRLQLKVSVCWMTGIRTNKAWKQTVLHEARRARLQPL